MEKLIVKFRIEDNILFAQILNQDNIHRNYVRFRSSTGFLISSISHPQFGPAGNELYIRGSTSHMDNIEISSYFPDKQELFKYVFNLKKAINEFNQHYGAT